MIKCNEERITGMMIYYYFVCKRKLWYFANEIYMEQNSELVSIGKAIDESTYKREEKSILIDNTINIDFIKDGAILHEIKKTKAIEEAGVWQVKYYMYYLRNRGVKKVKAKIDYPLIKETQEVVLEKEDEKEIEKIITEIKNIINQEKVPIKINERTCKKCAYFDICYL